MTNFWLFLIPLIGAIIGWIFNSIAINMLFRPLLPKKILGITIQGIIPKRQEEMAQKLGSFAGKQLLSFDGIEQKITDPENLKKILPQIEDHMDDFLHNRLKEQMPMISMFIGNKTIDSLKKVFMQEIEALLPKVMSSYTDNLKNSLNIEQLVAEKVATFPAAKIEETLRKEMKAEWRSIKLLGAICGFIIGIIQIVLTLLIT